LRNNVAKTGVEYYVIDCGWHNEEAGNIIYPSYFENSGLEDITDKDITKSTANT
jgi:hypothetical protein